MENGKEEKGRKRGKNRQAQNMPQVTSIKGIAEMCGVSASTVSRALNSKSCVREETREKILAAVAASGFRPNMLAKFLKEGGSKTICLMIPSYGNLIFPQIARGVVEEARSNGYNVFFGVTDERQDVEQATFESMLNRQVAGFVICSAYGSEDAIYRLHEESVPIVLVNRYKEDDIGRLDTVSCDNYKAGYEATTFLIRSGHRRIAIARGRDGQRELFLYKERFRGYCDALKDGGIVYDPQLVMHEPMEGEDGFYRLTKSLMEIDNPPDSIFASSDPKAFVIMHALHDLGKKIPQDVAVIGIDDVILSSYIEPPLTTIAQPLQKMGAVAVRKLLHQIEYKNKRGMLPAPENTILDYTLIVRKSTN